MLYPLMPKLPQLNFEFSKFIFLQMISENKSELLTIEPPKVTLSPKKIIL